jgi:predicted lysophospholipase L1 biosynthesis ABC-type transport system permease subunit
MDVPEIVIALIYRLIPLLTAVHIIPLFVLKKTPRSGVPAKIFVPEDASA